MPKDNKSKTIYPPVVAVLGHVDHGKTTLLDSVRKSSVAEKEHGGITQRIGASSVEVLHEGIKRRITFIDTPGHEAFFAMRSRGARVADVSLLVVSLVDGVMPQTKESIKLLQASKMPFIAVLTKSDSPEKNSEKVKQQLIKEDVVLEGYGGNVPLIEVSARDGSNIKELLDLILLVFDVTPSHASKTSPFEGVVIESRLDEKAGPRATLVIKNGSLAVRDEISSDGPKARVRTIINSLGEHIKEASVGDAVEILGFDKVPDVGIVFTKGGKAEAPVSVREESIPPQNPEGIVSLTLAAETQGALEAIVSALPTGAKLVSKKTGEITTADVLFAKSIGAIVLGFNVKIRPEVLKLAATEKVLVKNYKLIYEMLSEINDVIEGKELSMQEEIYGVAKILARFPYEKTEVLGIAVTDGRVAKGDKARIVRGDEVVGEARITSLRQGKEQISKVETGEEAGIIITPFLDFTIGDMVICHG
ncbi:MAG: hypothetical protein A2186_01215 [Candidatus Levybacteria bacterium RIFOXYA1_FULL_41_10]|nr:MAG: Translation initiation factor IF-2 [Candidatus Levybacteria bacterium GW2011_GWA1_39_32]KKR51427.1 MAG: Translation initiation factor IF-2 [Candidatus Levybacteria bacterium GW2011_GWC1_40_19]KKR94875.1 MAG: Translation initiation factor IF-2 [Candidatus Levybacteria bacterium GW2011_GWA2_41_15]KKS00877.1 MAG: Translation initiation factor IF-2 [Candidatus Levybacteria bacterium GW2011_GWB1_41_21]OGH20885.1 MAG: hypothetical protein A2695_01715 [Candidatus Levybacteria bacterium RIFCSPH